MSGYEGAARWALRVYQPEFLVLIPAWFPNLLAEVTQQNCGLRPLLSGADYDFPGDLRIFACE